MHAAPAALSGALSSGAAKVKPLLRSSAAPAKLTTLDGAGGATLPHLSVSVFPAAKLFPRGIVLGSLTLLAGEPGAGKSTLCLQLAHNFSATAPVLYFSSEESASQVKERGVRMGSFSKNFSLAESTSIEEIVATIEHHKPKVVFIDSLQRVVSSETESEAGSINQIRIITAALMDCAKRSGVAVVLIGHVTKGGQLAGPKTLEHLVDTVLSIESDKSSKYRIVRAYKNRFGEGGTVSVMQLGSSGFIEVKDAATIFIQDYAPKPGSVISVTSIEDQFFFIEVQALVAKTTFGYAKRTASGFPKARLELLLAIMKKHLHIDFDSYDVYVNIAGGFYVDEPAMDLAVALAVLSSLKDALVPGGTVVFGELGLSGELRTVKNTSLRLSEIVKNKFTRVFAPPLQQKVQTKIEFSALSSLQEVVKYLRW